MVMLVHASEELVDHPCQGFSGNGSTHAMILASEDRFAGNVDSAIEGGFVRGQSAVADFRQFSF